MGTRTLIQGGIVIAFDGKRHRFLKDGQVVFEGSEIRFVGKGFNSPVERVIDARGRVVSPGFISTHAHLYESPFDRSFIEDRGNPLFYYSGLYEHLPAREGPMDREMIRDCFWYSLAELLHSGTTTVVEIGPYTEDLLPIVPRVGNRVYIGRSFRSGEWYTPDGKEVRYRWFEDGGRERLEEAVRLIQEHDGSCDGLIRGILAAGQADTCSEELLRDTQAWAHRLGVPVTLHASQSVIEFNEMLKRHGKTPIAWLQDIGFLQRNVILGHAIIVGGSTWTNYPPGDLEILAQSGCSVAHSPWVFIRRGIAMESFYRYQQAGIQMTLGTDTCPQNMIHAMRWAAIISKTMERRTDATTAADVFNAATLNGASALGRHDLGRLSPGAKADIVIFSGDTTNMVPLRDPVKNIVYSAEMGDVETVIINGCTVLEQGTVKGLNEKELNRRLQRAAERLWPAIKEHDWAHRSVDELSPPSFEVWEP
ncbi:MAG: chlorohydrolase family protein [Thermodesulfobacteriota bacterium]